MNMNERKIKILEAIIHDYIKTGEPVGSRTISKKYDLGVSSATIRNEMADLEEMGYIAQPHTSAGRIPSDLGYRLYVDKLMQYPKITQDYATIIGKMLQRNIGKIDDLMQETANLLALMTNYTTLVTAPSIRRTKLKHLQLIPIEGNTVALVTVTDANIVRHNVIRMPMEIPSEMFPKLSEILNHHLQGQTLNDIDMELVDKLKASLSEYEDIVAIIMEVLLETMEEDTTPDIFTSGVMNMLSFPEFKDVGKAKTIYETLEEKVLLAKLLEDTTSNGVQITIGKEHGIEQIKDCSIITSNYKIGEYTVGAIGLIGPTRMNYGQAVSVVQYLSNHMNMLLSQVTDK
ncbi:MAG: heat-inducible transcription repressor HrcA [Epulopiscium sp.]|nr:heat-inducible transcription repressor HrcA [Candidatus Epulonipiscium sp.]